MVLIAGNYTDAESAVTDGDYSKQATIKKAKGY